MANTDQVTDFDAQEGGEAFSPSESESLKSLLNAVVAQLNDTDRRHSESLSGLQQRLESRLEILSREAESLRNNVPADLTSAIDRIEHALALLGERLADTTWQANADVEQQATGDLAEDQSGYASVASTDETDHSDEQPEPPMASDEGHSASPAEEPPFALRSAVPADYTLQASSRMTGEVDPFDVIESRADSDDDDGNNPWDQESAQALSDFYGAGDVPAGSEPYDAGSSSEQSVTQSADMQGHSAASMDLSWLQTRFDEIAERLEASINDIRPDREFFALGQRIDNLELQITQAVESIQSSGGGDALNVVESHIGELAGYLEGTNVQLARLEAIETQLAMVSERIEEVHAIARSASEAPGEGGSDFDVESVARAAATEATSAFASQFPASAGGDASDLRETLNAFIDERRQGDELIVSSLDTLQQAVARLLDRVEPLEAPSGEIAADMTSGEASAADYEATVTEFVDDQRQAADSSHSEDEHYHADRESNVADIPYSTSRVERKPAPKPMASAAHTIPEVLSVDGEARAPDADFENERVAERPQPDAAPPPAQRTPAQMRQDFIADARRAKSRLTAEVEGGEGFAVGPGAPESSVESPVVNRPMSDIRSQLLKNDAMGGTAGSAPTEGRSGEKSKQQATKSGGTPSHRLVLLGILALMALGGLWYSLDSAAPRGPVIDQAPQAGSQAPAASESAPEAGAGSVDPASERAPGVTPGSTDGDVAPPMPEFETRGEIVPGDVVVGSTSMALPGIAVDAEKAPTAELLEGAPRRQAMAEMSTTLGKAAARMVNSVPTPLSLAPRLPAAEPASHSPAKSPSASKSTSSQLDMPPAAIGPLSLRLAAANGDASAEFNVGARFAEASGVKQDFKQAAHWYQRSAVKGFAQAQYRLGTLYERGLGVRTDAIKAAVWYKAAAAQGNIKAMHNLAVLKANSNDGAPDYMSAANLFEQAAQYGLADSQFNLAILFENGLGVGKDLKKAYKWLALAARSGDADTINRRELVKRQLSPEALAEAERLVRTFRPRQRDRIINDARAAGEAWKKS